MAKDEHRITLLKADEVESYGVSRDPKADGYCSQCWKPVSKIGGRWKHRAPVAGRGI